MGHNRVATPMLDFSFTGPGSGDLEVRGLADPLDAVPYMESCLPTYPARVYRRNPTAAKNWYVALAGNDAWDGTSPTFVSGTVGPKRTWKSAYDALPGTDAVDLDQINLVALGSLAEFNEGGYNSLTKSVRTVPDQANTAPAVIEGRGPALTGTKEGAANRWSFPYVCDHEPAVDEGQASLQSTSVSFGNQGARWADRITIDCLCELPVSWDGVLLPPAASDQLSSLTRSGTTATAVSAAPHGLSTGDTVAITAVDLNVGDEPHVPTGALGASLTNVATSITLAPGDGAKFPASGAFTVRIDAEVIAIASRSTDTLTVSDRGARSTTAASHANGAVVEWLPPPKVSTTSYNAVVAVTVVNSTTFTYPVTVTAGDATHSSSPDLTAAGTTVNGIRFVGRRKVDGTPTYFHDNVNDLLWIGTDPSGHVVRAATYEGFANHTGGTVVLMGCILRGFATTYGGSFPHYARAMLFNTTAIVENNFIGFCPDDGIGCGTTASKIVRDNSFAWCRTGCSSTSSAGNLLFTLNICRFMNWFGGSKAGWHMGGLKAANVTDYTITYNVVQMCRGPGIWLDYASGRNKVLHNYLWYCNNFGIDFEKNQPAGADETWVAGNLVRDTLWAHGHTGSPNTKAFNNTCWGNGLTVRLFDDSRSPTHNVEAGGHLYENEIWVASPSSVLHGQYKRNIFATSDDVAAGVDATNWLASLDRVVMHEEAGMAYDGSGGTIQHDGGAVKTTYSYPDWRTAYPALNPNGVGPPASGTNPHPLVEPAFGDFRRSPATVGKGVVRTALQAAALGPAYGLAGAVNPGVGALAYPGAKPTIYSLRHTFTGADSATVSGNADSGQTPTVHAGDFGISGNKGYFSTDVDDNLVTWPCKVMDGHVYATIEGTLASATNFRSPCLTFRHVAGAETTDFLFVSLVNGALAVRKSDAGVQSTILSQSGLTTLSGVQYRLHVVCDHELIRVYLDDVLAVSTSLGAANAKYRAGTRVGCLWNKAGAPATAARIDDVYALLL